jgi:hypothetical protein
MKIGNGYGKNTWSESDQGPMVAPTPELPDDIPIERALFSTKIQNALRAADLRKLALLCCFDNANRERVARRPA